MSFSLHQTYEQEIEIALASSEIARTLLWDCRNDKVLVGAGDFTLRSSSVEAQHVVEGEQVINTENTATGCALYLSNRYVEARGAVGEQVIPASSANLSNVIIRFFLINPLTWRRRRLL